MPSIMDTASDLQEIDELMGPVDIQRPVRIRKERPKVTIFEEKSIYQELAERFQSVADIYRALADEY